jgi:quercetin dioxygenase-like cupin family protein
MRHTRSCLRVALAIAGFIALSAHAQISYAQQSPSATPVRAVLGVTNLPSVVGTPMFLKLSKVAVPAGQSTSYVGPVGFIYVLSGSLSAQLEGGRHSLGQGDALLVAAKAHYSFIAIGPEPAVFLHYVLARAAELPEAATSEPASMTELYRSPPIPHLKPGPYEFTLTRVSFPPRMPINPPHYRSGAALYYVLAGSGTFVADGKTERKEIGTSHFEPYGWVHQWGNAGDTPLVLLQANISEEGVPAVIVGHPPSP